MLLAPTFQYDIIYAPKLRNSLLNSSNFIGMKMHGREAKVNISDWGAEAPGQQVMLGSHRRERLHPHVLFPWREVAFHIQGHLWPSLQGLHLLFSVFSSFFLNCVCCRFSYSMWPTKDKFSLRLFLVIFIVRLASPEFSLSLSSSNCVSSSLSLIL